MKKLLLSLSLVAFAVAAQAGDNAACQEKSSCCSSTKVTQVKSETCPVSGKATSCSMAKASKEKQSVAKSLQTPKAMTLAQK
jgi:hypothetical protein